MENRRRPLPQRSRASLERQGEQLTNFGTIRPGEKAAEAGLAQLGLAQEKAIRVCAKQLKDSSYAEAALRHSGQPAVPSLIDALGAGVDGWAEGQRVGIGFLGGHCGTCESCRRGNFVACANQPWTGMNVDGR